MNAQSTNSFDRCYIAANRRGPVIFPKLAGAQQSWFALYVQVNHEKEITRRLHQKSLECFLPLIETWSKRQDRRKRVQVPLFPGYVFFNTILDNYTNVHVLQTPGAVSILKNSEGPVPIPDYQITSLMTMLAAPQSVSIHPYLKEGDWVQVAKGYLAGCVGILLRQDARKGRLVLNIDIIRQSVAVELDIEDVEPLRSPSARKAS